MEYILGIDQSTQGTKAVLVDSHGDMIGRADFAHQQIINEKGWVSHDLEEIYTNVLKAARAVVEKTGIDKKEIRAVGISNQRETTAIWNRDGKPLNQAIVWQCSRAAEMMKKVQPYGDEIRAVTGIPLSPFFPAAKMAWLLDYTEGIADMLEEDICLGTMDSWLIYRLTGGKEFKTDYSNASRTQLFDIRNLCWSKKICSYFGIPQKCLPEVCDSDSLFGMTDFEGFLEQPIPIYGVAGDSHAALFGQGCHEKGMLKTTYGTGSSIMMNTGEECITSSHGLVTSLAWKLNGRVNYVLEGNINYTGAVITWLKDDMKLIESPSETADMARAANSEDQTVLVPAFSGLSMPYWKNDARAMLYGMTRTTGRNEVVKAALESIVLQIEAVLNAMRKDSGIEIREVRTDGGPTRNDYLMQLQSDLSDTTVIPAKVEELSAIGASYMAGMGCGLYSDKEIFCGTGQNRYLPQMKESVRQEKLRRWEEAVEMV